MLTIDIELLKRLRNVGLDLVFLSYSKFSSLLNDEEYEELNETALQIDELFIEYIFIDYDDNDEREIINHVVTEFHRVPKQRPTLDFIIEEIKRGEDMVKALTMKYMNDFNRLEIEYDRDYTQKLDFAPVCSLVKPRENVFDCCWCTPIRQTDKFISYLLGLYIAHISAVHFANIEYEMWHDDAKTFEEFFAIYEKRKRFDNVVDYLVQVNNYLKVNDY